MILELTENGRSLFDRMQKNLSAVAQSSDAELSASDPWQEMFGEAKDPEARREDARNTQDKLDRQGREAFTAEYAENQIKNYGS